MLVLRRPTEFKANVRTADDLPDVLSVSLTQQLSPDVTTLHATSCTGPLVHRSPVKLQASCSLDSIRTCMGLSTSQTSARCPTVDAGGALYTYVSLQENVTSSGLTSSFASSMPSGFNHASWHAWFQYIIAQEVPSSSSQNLLMLHRRSPNWTP